MSGSTVWWIASVRSVPTRSAFSSGPSTASRRPNARLDHGVDGLGVADAVLDQRHRLAPERVLQSVADEAGHILLHMRRLLAGVGVQLHRAVDRLRRGPLRADHLDQRHQSTAGSTNACRARARAAASPPMISVIGMTEVLLARIVSGRTCSSISANSFCLSGKFSGDRLDDEIGIAHRRREIAMRRHTLDRARIVAEVLQARGDARLRSCRGSPRRCR